MQKQISPLGLLMEGCSRRSLAWLCGAGALWEGRDGVENAVVTVGEITVVPNKTTKNHARAAAPALKTAHSQGEGGG